MAKSGRDFHNTQRSVICVILTKNVVKRNHQNISFRKVCRLAVEMINYSSRFRYARCGWQAGRERTARGCHCVDRAGRTRRPRRPTTGGQGNTIICL